MGLSQQIQSAIATGFAALGDVKQAITYTTSVEGVYDPSAGNSDAVETDYPLDVVIAEYDAHQIDGTLVRANDRQIIVDAISVTFTPKPGDKITNDTNEYHVVNASQDPAKASWTMQVRR